MKVLIIDDDKFVSTLLESELRQENIDVARTGDGETGLAKLMQWRPDVVVLDLILPKTDGFAVLEKLKKLPEAKSTMILVYSSLSQRHDMDEAVRLGAHKCFVKGEHTVQHIVEVVRHFLLEKANDRK